MMESKEEEVQPPLHDRLYPELSGQVVTVDRVFRLFLRVYVKWQGRWWPANINRDPYFTSLTAKDYAYIKRELYELNRYFTVGDQFRIDEIIGCRDHRAQANFNIVCCECTNLLSRHEDLLGVIFTNFGARMPTYFSRDVEDDGASWIGRQKKIFICSDGLTREFMKKVRDYESYHCIAFESHFRQCDVDKNAPEEQEVEFDFEVGDHPEGIRYKARRGQFVLMDAVYPEDRRFPMMAYGEVLTPEEVQSYRLPYGEDEDWPSEKFVHLVLNLNNFVMELEKAAVRKMAVDGLVEIEMTHYVGGDHLPLEGRFRYKIPGRDSKSFLRPMIGGDLHFTMWLDEYGYRRKEFVGKVSGVQIIPGGRIEVNVDFSSRTAVDLILTNTIRRRNYGVEVRERFDGSGYKLMRRILSSHVATCLSPDYLNQFYPPRGRDYVLQMLMCMIKENPDVDGGIVVRGIEAPGIPLMNQPGQLMAIRAVFEEKRSVTCIEGPWGTGKTLSIVAMIYRLVKENDSKTFLITAQTNLVVDHITSVLGIVQEAMERDGDYSLRICRSYSNAHRAKVGGDQVRRYAPWKLTKEPDERETEVMRDLREKVEGRTEELQSIEVSLDDRKEGGLKSLKIKLMSCLVKLIEGVYMPRLRMLWMIELNPNVILSTISNTLVFHMGCSLLDEDDLVQKIKKIRHKLYGDVLVDIELGETENFSDEEEIEDAEGAADDRDQEVDIPKCGDPVVVAFDNIVSRRYQGIICDESGQILQHVAIALCMLLDRDDQGVQMIFVGDRFQLGPFTYSICGGEVQKMLDTSVLEMLVDEKVCAFVQFGHTFRAHPSLVEFLKDNVYGEKLKLTSMVEPADRQLLTSTPHFSNFLACVDGVVVPNLFFNYNYYEEVAGGKSILNRCEAHIAIIILEHLYYKNQIDLSQIMLLTMYESQNRLLKQLLVDSPFKVCQDGSGRRVDVRNVDGSQGQERDIVILLTSRCNLGRNIGFLKNKRRANVALSRARHGLIVLGNMDTLGSDHDFWRPLVYKYMCEGCLYNVEMSCGLMQAEGMGIRRYANDGRDHKNLFFSG